jgi:hypothetical protein
VDRIRFTGRVLPAFHTITADNTQRIDLSDEAFRSVIAIQIKDSVVTVDCDVDSYRAEMTGELYRRAFRLAKAALDLISFSTGNGLFLILDHCTPPTGESRAINFHYPDAPGLCTAYTINSTEFTIALVNSLKEQALLMALSDLAETITWPDCATIHCARAVEGIRTLIDPNPDRAAGWATMHKSLNCTDRYLRLITDTSRDHRHGYYTPVTNLTAEEVRNRAWTIMNRFLEYRKRGNQPLPITDFPLLGGDRS